MARLCLVWLMVLALVQAECREIRAQAEKPSLLGKLIYFGHADDEVAATLWIRVQSRNGADEKIVPIEAQAQAGRVSPRGDRLAFWSVHGGQAGVWLISADGDQRTLLVETPHESWIGAWSPDGKRLVYGHGDSDNRSNLLIDVNSKSIQRIPVPAADAIWDWSPEGNEFLTISAQETGRQIQSARLDGTQLICLTMRGTDNISPRFSPDGKQVLFSSTRTMRSQLYVMDRDGSNVRQITKFSDRSCSNGCWTPDGKEICCRAYKTGAVTESGYAVFDPEVILMNADGSDPKVFLPANRSIGWSLDWR